MKGADILRPKQPAERPQIINELQIFKLAMKGKDLGDLIAGYGQNGPGFVR